MKKKRRLRHVLGVIGLFLILVGVLGIVYYISQSDYFMIRALSIEPPSSDSGEVMSIIKNSIRKNNKFHSLFNENHVLFYPSNKVIENISTTRKYYKSVIVDRSLIRKTVSIQLMERDPYGVYCQLNSYCFLFDAQGFFIESASTASTTTSLIVKDQNATQVTLGTPFISIKKDLDNLLSTLNLLNGSGLGIDYITLESGIMREWTVRLVNGPVLVFSYDVFRTELVEELRGLQSIMKNSAEIDLRVANKIYYK